MPKLPIISGKKAVQTLEKIGFVKSRQTGSHIVLKKLISGGEIVCVVPLHKELRVGTLSGILKQAQVTVNDFIPNPNGRVCHPRLAINYKANSLSLMN